MLKHAQAELSTPAEAVEAAVVLLHGGTPLASVREHLQERFRLGGAACKRVVEAALAALIENFEAAAIERWLEEASRADLRTMTPAERRRHETKLGQVFQGLDLLLDPDATAAETVAAARTLDKLLALGWRKRLPKGALD